MLPILFFLLHNKPPEHVARLTAQSDVDVSELFKTSKVNHPVCTIFKEDIERALENSEKHSWAADKIRRIKKTADSNLEFYQKAGVDANSVPFDESFNDELLDKMVPKTTPASKTFCPHCEATGKSFHPNGNWKWSESNPDVIICNVCGMTFPNYELYPESLKYQSKWDPTQTITFVKNGPIKCMNYMACRSSVDGVIRGYKFKAVISKLQMVSQAYALTNDAKYAKFVRKLLLKLAERFPKYMVYCAYSYNEYADCDPHEAVKNLPYLPNKTGINYPKIAVDPNERNFVFFSGYWSSSRMGTSGEDGELVTLLAEAYDLTCEATEVNSKNQKINIFSDSEKEKIMKDLLIESALLGFYDPDINNKAVMNKKGTTMVGLVVGNAKLARFGLIGFFETLEDAFYKDGSPKESIMYGFKSLDGLDGLGQAFRNYSDPEYFVPSGPNDKVYKNLNVNKDTEIDLSYQAMMWTTYGNFVYPTIDDNDHGTKFFTKLIEYLGMMFPTNDFQSFVNNIRYTQNLANNDAVFYRDPSNEITNVSYKMRDIVFPYKNQGYLRTDETNIADKNIDNNGKRSLVVLDASEGYGHFHYGSLNLVYWKDGRELLHDLGYLNDHPNKSMTERTVVHNTVLIDGLNQVGKGRGGVFHLFDTTSDLIKVMQASSNPYPDRNVDVYNRTVVQIQHKQSKKDYLVDIFRVRGGKTRIENVFHGVNQDYELNKDYKFDQTYDVTKINGYLSMLIQSSGTLEISDIVIREKFMNGKIGEKLNKPIPNSVNPKKCNEGEYYCFNMIKGVGNWSVIEGSKENEKGFKLVVEPSDRYMFEFHVGYGDDIPKDNMELRFNARYEVELMMRGTLSPKRYEIYYSNEEIPKTTSRWKQSSSLALHPTEWRKFSGTIDIGTPMIDAEGTFTKELFSAKWKVDENYTFKAMIPAREKEGQKIFLDKEGWGQRYNDNRDIGTTLPYFFVNRNKTPENEPERIETFVTVFEGSENNKDMVNSVDVIDDNQGNVFIKIDTKDGIDYVASSYNNTEINGYNIKTDARLAVQTIDQTIVYDGTIYTNGNKKDLAPSLGFFGEIIGFNDNRTHGWYEVSNKQIEANKIKCCKKQVLYVVDSTNESEKNYIRSYPIYKITKFGNNNRIYTRIDSEGFYPQYADTFKITGIKIDGTEINEEIYDEAPTGNDGNDDNGNGDSGKGDKGKMPAGAIAGVVIAVIVVVGAVIGGLVYYYKIKLNKLDSSEGEVQHQTIV